jgi:hypothetical protein
MNNGRKIKVTPRHLQEIRYSGSGLLYRSRLERS